MPRTTPAHGARKFRAGHRTGTSTYVGPGQTTSQGTQETATVVAFDLGTCRGTLAYRAIEWYFPRHGQTFDPATSHNICDGTHIGQR